MSHSVLAKSLEGSNQWAQEMLKSWDSKGLLDLENGAKIASGKEVTRGEFIAIVNRIFNFTEQVELKFADVADDAWYKNDLMKAVSAGYITGSYNQNGQLEARAEQRVSRQEAATIIARVFEFPEHTDPFHILKVFKDWSEIGAFSSSSVASLVSRGYIAGYPDQTFRANNWITLAEAVKMLDNVSGDIITTKGSYSGKYEGNLIINTAGVTLEDVYIAGDLYLAEGIGAGKVNLNRVTVAGKTVVNGGGPESIIISDSKLTGDLIVNSRVSKVRVHLTGTTVVSSFIIFTGSRIQNESGTQVRKVFITPDHVQQEVVLEGSYEDVVLSGDDSTIDIKNGSVKNLAIASSNNKSSKKLVVTVHETARILLLSIDRALHLKGAGKIEKAQINVNDVNIDKWPDQVHIARGIKANIDGAEVAEGDRSKPPVMVGYIPPFNGGGVDPGQEPEQQELDAADVDKAVEKLTLGDLSSVIADIELATEGDYGTTIAWQSDNPSVVSVNGAIGQVTRPNIGSPDEVVTLTASVSKGKAQKNKTFTATVKAKVREDNEPGQQELDAADVDKAVEELTLGDLSTVIADIQLATKGDYGTTIAWQSDNPSVVSVNGEIGQVTRPNIGSPDEVVTLTATVSKGASQKNKTFIATVKANEPGQLELDAADVDKAVEELTLGDLSTVIADIELATEGDHGTTIAWQSDKPSVVSVNGEIGQVTRPNIGSPDEVVKLTATVSKGASQKNKTFIATVKANEPNQQELDAADVDKAVEELTLGDLSFVIADIELATEGDHGTTIAWQSDKPSVVSVNGEIGQVTRPNIGSPDEVVKLTATVSKGASQKNKTFIATVKANEPGQLELDAADVDKAVEELTLGDLSTVIADIQLATKGDYGTTIAWQSDNPSVFSVNGAIGQVTRPKVGAPDEVVTLTATVSKGASQKNKTFIATVKANEPSQQELDAADVDKAIEELTLGDLSFVIADIELATEGEYGTAIAWQSDNPRVISVNGEIGQVTRPNVGGADEVVKLTATVSKGAAQENKTFTVTVKAKVTKELRSFSINGYNAVINQSGATVKVFVPKSTDLSTASLGFTYSGDKVLINGTEVVAGGVYPLTKQNEIAVVSGDVRKYTLIIDEVNSALPTVIINSQGRSVIDRHLKADGTMVLLDEKGLKSSKSLSLYDGAITIKGRGNSSWSMPKKSYAITTDKKTKLLDMPKDDDWVLIANYADKTLMRNYTAYQFAASLGMEYSPRMRFVELFLNGEYLGNYLLGEKIKISENRLAINKMSADDKSGEDITGGYLIEKDWLSRLEDDDLYFTTNRVIGNNVFVIKTPKAKNINEEQLAYIKNYFTEAEDALYGNQFSDPEKGYAKYFDVDSLVDWYIVNELYKNLDASFGTSVYLYKDKGGKLKFGPVWDFDIGAGNANYGTGDDPEKFYIKNGLWISRFFKDPAFVEKVKKRWSDIRGNQIEDLFTLIDQTSSKLEQSQQYNFAKWPILGKYVWPNPAGVEQRTTYVSEVTYLTSWLRQRVEWLDQGFKDL